MGYIAGIHGTPYIAAPLKSVMGIDNDQIVAISATILLLNCCNKTDAN
jgi:hypothetical protein